MVSKTTKEAAALWHDRIGRFITHVGAEASLSASYACFKKDGKPIQMRLGACLASVVMVDANEAILVDKLNIGTMASVDQDECTFKYGEHVKGVYNLSKMQINWALDEKRVYPLLLLRPGKKNPMECLTLSYSADQINVCIPTGSFSFDANKVRVARDFILANGLEKLWRKAADLRQEIGLGSHLKRSDYLKNKLLADHAAMLEKIPLSVWLPVPMSGEHLALGDALAEKPGLDIEAMPTARALFLKIQETKNVA